MHSKQTKVDSSAPPLGLNSPGLPVSQGGKEAEMAASPIVCSQIVAKMTTAIPPTNSLVKGLGLTDTAGLFDLFLISYISYSPQSTIPARAP